jgi:hypothetical protein
LIPPYPLVWPEGVPRTSRPVSGQFKTSLSRAIENVEDSLRRFAADSNQRITDIQITRMTAPLPGAQPADKGVAVWFTWDGEQRCIPVDRYDRLEGNAQAIHHIIEARRSELLHGGMTTVRQSFKGFTALPPPEGSPPRKPWHMVLGVPPSASPAEIDAAWKAKMRIAHPNAGGSAPAVHLLNQAREEGKTR